ncbi:MAG: FAD-dependent monooxygenase [Bacteroides sp.]|nr:FAD-dependent monooxygenase [Prevotella sp.]MCM1408067.1 FAD-dependent monooxygenase [Treponema brennaborense]MCM1469043.1 FAD-dependent monooxygenase [Bacteroides sp.]
MIYELTITVRPEDETNKKLIRKKIAEKLSEKNPMSAQDSSCSFVLEKKSIDARHGKIKLQLKYAVHIGEDSQECMQDDAAKKPFAPAWKNADPKKRVVIIGCGPAGLFAALRLLENGITPVILERGTDTAHRKTDIAAISRTQTVNADSNYCFGEGGAGTFSDGKLRTRSRKRGNPSRILEILHYFGADESILTDAHPHIGTDKLPVIINALTSAIRSFGGQIHFNTKCESLIISNNKVCGADAVNTISGSRSSFEGRAVIAASGHSAPDIYMMLDGIEKNIGGRILEPKTFAMGVRVEHPRSIIDAIQYHGKARSRVLPAAEYQLAAQIDGRGVYSFCMCPGGLVVPSAADNSSIVVNGMSPASRNTRWSNAAIVAETRPEDIPEQFGSGALSGLRYRTWIEQTAQAESGGGQKAPAQMLEDFLAGKKSAALPESSYTPGLVSSRLDRWLPEHITSRLKQAFLQFNAKMRGFICPEALLIAPETRTSSPLRILRENTTFENPSLRGLFPAGEGAGYSGGIVSSAIDGENAACAVCNTYFRE